MIFTHHGMNSILRAKGPSYGSVVIGDKTYRTVIIGNQEWIVENLDYKFSGVSIGVSGSPSVPAAWYYNNDEVTYSARKCGLLYNWYAVKLLEDNKSTLCPGWHVPTQDEWTALANAVGGVSTAGTKLKALDNSIISGWPSGWNGTDDYDFAALPAGYRNSGSFNRLGSFANFWTATEHSSTYAYSCFFDTRASMFSSYDGKTSFAFSVRLVKDA